MTVAAADYFRHLRAYLSSDFIVDDGSKGTLTLEEEYFTAEGTKPMTRRVQLSFKGDAFVFNLDRKEEASKKKSKERAGGKSVKLFNFLEDSGQPWSKKCDFIIFQQYQRSVLVHCIEFKSDGVDVDRITKQLHASVCWVRSLSRVIEHYCDMKHSLRVRKFVFCSRDDVSPYTDNEGKYLNREPSIRLFRYADLEGVSIEELENTSFVRV